jgi:hypothetical protein
MPERGIEVVAPKQIDDAAAEPDALWIPGGTADLGGSFRELIGAALRILGRITGLAGRRGLVARLGVGGLCLRGQRCQQEQRCRKHQWQNTREKGHDRAGFYGSLNFATDDLTSLDNEWVSIATCRLIRTSPRCRTAPAVVQRGTSTCLKCRTLAGFPTAAKPDKRVG